jgi:hypothetical protein
MKMKITRKSPFSKTEHTMEIDVRKSQLDSWVHGMHIQDAMPNVPAEQREFIMTGITPEEWAETFEGEE